MQRLSLLSLVFLSQEAQALTKEPLTALGDGFVGAARMAYGTTTMIMDRLSELPQIRSQDALSAAHSAQKLLLDSSPELEYPLLSRSVEEALSAMKHSASEAVRAALRSAEALAEAEHRLQAAREFAMQSSQKSSEAAVFFAAARAAAAPAAEEGTWSSAAGTDRWLVEEVYPHRLQPAAGASPSTRLPSGSDASGGVPAAVAVGAAGAVERSRPDSSSTSSRSSSSSRGPPPLYFVDVGANDGVSLSQTLSLEQRFGWRGICVEASDVHFRALELARPDCANVNACLSSTPGVNVSFAVDTSILTKDEMAFTGMYSGIVDTNTAMRSGWNAAAAPHATKTTTVLEQVLLQQKAPDFIELLSLDCEGCELGLLSTFPFGRPWVFGAIVVEHNAQEKRRRDIRSVLERAGYVRAVVGAVDDSYVVDQMPELVPLSASLPRPFLDLAHRQHLQQHRHQHEQHEEATEGSAGWSCPLDVSTVLAGAVSGACPLPSSDSGYSRTRLLAAEQRGDDDDHGDDKEKEVKEGKEEDDLRHQVTVPFQSFCRDLSVPGEGGDAAAAAASHSTRLLGSSGDSGGSLGAFQDVLVALGLNAPSSRLVADVMLAEAHRTLCTPPIAAQGESSLGKAAAAATPAVAAAGSSSSSSSSSFSSSISFSSSSPLPLPLPPSFDAILVSLSALPGFVARVSSVEDKQEAASAASATAAANFVTIPLQKRTAAARGGGAEAGRAAVLPPQDLLLEPPSEASVNATVTRACDYLAVPSSEECAQLGATLALSLHSFRKVLAYGSDEQAAAGVAGVAAAAGAAGAAERGGRPSPRPDVFQLHVYLDACRAVAHERSGASSSSSRSSGSGSAVPELRVWDPDADCVSEAWSVGLVRLDDDDPNDPPKLTIRPITRPAGHVEMSANGPSEFSVANFLRRAAAAGLRKRAL